MHSVGDHERVNRVPHSTWHPFWGSPPLSQTYTQRTQSLQTGNWFVHQDFSYSRQAQRQISGKTTRDSRVSHLHLHVDSRVKENPPLNPFQHSAQQQSKEVAVWSYEISFQANGGESSSRNSKTAALLYRSILTTGPQLHQGGKKMAKPKIIGQDLREILGAKKKKKEKRKKKDDDADNRKQVLLSFSS